MWKAGILTFLKKHITSYSFCFQIKYLPNINLNHIFNILEFYLVYRLTFFQLMQCLWRMFHLFLHSVILLVLQHVPMSEHWLLGEKGREKEESHQGSYEDAACPSRQTSKLQCCVSPTVATTKSVEHLITDVLDHKPSSVKWMSFNSACLK